MTQTPMNTLEWPLRDQALMALKEAVAEVVEDAIRNGRPLYTWRNGEVVAVSPEELRVGR